MLLKVILIALTMFLSVMGQSSNLETSYYDYKMIELISTMDHEECYVHTSSKITLIQCTANFEAYLT